MNQETEVRGNGVKMALRLLFSVKALEPFIKKDGKMAVESFMTITRL